MSISEVMAALEAAGDERTKKSYLSRGAQLPLAGVTNARQKTIAKPLMGDQVLADALYATGHYDAMYLAGMIADPLAMTAADFQRWMDGAYCPMVGDYIVSVTLAESPLAEEIADGWIKSGEEVRLSAGYSCYQWLLGVRKNETFNTDKLRRMLGEVQNDIAAAPESVQNAMLGFVAAVGVSYPPLHEAALAVARQLGDAYTLKQIEQAAARGKIGFKRKGVRC